MGGECLKDPTYGFVFIPSFFFSEKAGLCNLEGNELWRRIRIELLGFSILKKDDSTEEMQNGVSDNLL